MTTPQQMEFDAQDRAEVFDEETLDEAEMRTFDEMPDVFDSTSALGDAREVRAMDEADFDEDDLDDEDLEDDEDLDDTVHDDLETVADDADAGSDDLDERDGITRLAGDEGQIEYVADVDRVTNARDDEAEKYESRRLSDEALRQLGYEMQDGKPRSEKDEERGSGASPDDVPEESNPRQEELLDEGVEETFPASDPVSVKRIT